MFLSLQLELRHLITREILIYPGYIPEPGVKYRVFHYGLEFKVGNWSFDKADWREFDLVNTCWAEFPGPPDPSTLDHTDQNLLNRDLLSIECARTLNEALHLHHIRRSCPASGVLKGQEELKEATVSRKLGRLERTFAFRKNPDEYSLEKSSTWKHWLIAMWIFFGLGLLTVASVIISGRKGKKPKGKGYRNKRRSSTHGDDR